ncbi:MAG: phosphoribosylanthranilate isomerase [Ignavibacteria bacterium]|nr:phosphoribosylanthranilate isomerase [Ignavibacteria bacterium]
MRRPVVKICCISSVYEAITAVECGASALGLVSGMPSGPGVISDEQISGILKYVPGNISSFLLTSKITAEGIIEQHRKFNTTAIQIVDEVELNVYEKIKQSLPEVKIVQVVHVTDESSVNYAISVSQFADALLLDSGNPKKEIKELGGTGRVHNWSISRQIREAVTIPVYLAGGLNSGNVINAIETVEPYGVDLCSGVRTDGKLDIIKLKEFFNKVKSVDS